MYRPRRKRSPSARGRGLAGLSRKRRSPGPPGPPGGSRVAGGEPRRCQTRGREGGNKLELSCADDASAGARDRSEPCVINATSTKRKGDEDDKHPRGREGGRGVRPSGKRRH